MWCVLNTGLTTVSSGNCPCNRSHQSWHLLLTRAHSARTHVYHPIYHPSIIHRTCSSIIRSIIRSIILHRQIDKDLSSTIYHPVYHPSVIHRTCPSIIQSIIRRSGNPLVEVACHINCARMQLVVPEPTCRPPRPARAEPAGLPMQSEPEPEADIYISPILTPPRQQRLLVQIVFASQGHTGTWNWAARNVHREHRLPCTVDAESTDCTVLCV